MTAARAKLVGQGLALAAVIGLLGLLVWSVVHSDGGAAAQLAAGRSPAAPDFTLERLDDEGSLSIWTSAGRR